MAFCLQQITPKKLYKTPQIKGTSLADKNQTNRSNIQNNGNAIHTMKKAT